MKKIGKIAVLSALLCGLIFGGSALAEETEKSDTLVVYFSCTGTTKGVAEKLAEVTDADLYEIVPAQPYTDEDLNYNDRSTRATTEQDHPDTRPEMAGEELDLEGYKTLYLGYPIWWGEEPRILCTFVEAYDFTDITVIPFCTSGGSGIGRSGEDLEEKAGTGTWKKGMRFSGTVSEDELKEWVDGLSAIGVSERGAGGRTHM